MSQPRRGFTFIELLVVIAVIANGLGLLNLPAGVNYIVTGGVLVLAATVDAVSRVRAGGSVIRT